MTVGKKLFPDGHLIDVNSNMAMRKNIKYDSTHWLALDEQESFLYFQYLYHPLTPLCLFDDPKMQTEFGFIVSYNHENLDPHTLLENWFLVVHVVKSLSLP